MISIQQFRSFFLTISLAGLLATTLAFGFGSEDSWAANSFTQGIDQLHTQISWMDKSKAMTKNLEGKTQEAIGNMTGNPKDQIMGKAKQVESQARNSAADMKDKMKSNGRAKAVTKNIEGKVQEAKGKATGNRKDQFVGKAKQGESQARNVVEDVKNKVLDTFN